MVAVSICIPMYNSNFNYLKQAILSVQNQNSKQWNLTVVDGSDVPSERVSGYISELGDSRIHYRINREDKSMAGNWNHCIDNAESELVTLLHDDDFLLPTYVESVLNMYHRFPNATAYFTGVKTVNGLGKPCLTMADRVKRFLKPKNDVITIRGDEGLASILAANYLFCPTFCYQKSKIKLSPFCKKWKMVTDLDFYAQSIIAQGYFVGLSEAHYIYRRHSKNQTSQLTTSLVRFDEEFAYYEKLATSLDCKTWPHTHKKASQKLMLKLHIIYLALRNLLQINITQAYKLLNKIK